MIIEIFEDVLTLGLFIVLNRNMPLLELRVLRVVLASNLLVLLADDIGFSSPVLIFKCLLVKELLFDLSFDRGRVNLLMQGLHSVQEDVI